MRRASAHPTRRLPTREHALNARLASALIAAAALCASVLGAFIGVADLMADEPRLALERWRAQARTGSGDEWTAVNHRLELARALAPRDAGHRAAVAETLTWWLAGAPAGSPWRAQVLAAARAEQLAALARRPTWAMAWARLAEIDYLAGAGAATLWPALERALQLGPWEPGVQLVTARVGLGLWESLDPARRARVDLATRRSLDTGSNHLALAMLAVHHGRVEWLASLSENAAYRRELAAHLANARR